MSPGKHPIRQGGDAAGRPARWEAGSQAAFVAKMNAAAGPAAPGSTRHAGVSGADPARAGTAAGPCPGRAGQLPGQVAAAPVPQRSRVHVYGSNSGV